MSIISTPAVKTTSQATGVKTSSVAARGKMCCTATGESINSMAIPATINFMPMPVTSASTPVGGDGSDQLFAYADVGVEFSPWGSTLWRGRRRLSGGNLRSEILVGGDGNDCLSGDLLSGPTYAVNTINADTVGGNDKLFGSSGNDQLYGGGGNDELWGGTGTDVLEGQAGNNTVYGGLGIDLLVLWTGASAGNDTLDGDEPNNPNDDNATDVLVINGTSAMTPCSYIAKPRPMVARSDSISITKSGRCNCWRPMVGRSSNNFRFPASRATIRSALSRLILSLPVGLVNPVATGLSLPLDLSYLGTRSRDIVTAPSRAIRQRSAHRRHRARLARWWSQEDVLYGFGGDDQLWGDTGGGGNLIDVLLADKAMMILSVRRGSERALCVVDRTETRLVPTPGALFDAGDVAGLISSGPDLSFGVYVEHPNGNCAVTMEI